MSSTGISTGYVRWVRCPKCQPRCHQLTVVARSSLWNSCATTHLNGRLEAEWRSLWNSGATRRMHTPYFCSTAAAVSRDETISSSAIVWKVQTFQPVMWFFERSGHFKMSNTEKLCAYLRRCGCSYMFDSERSSFLCLWQTVPRSASNQDRQWWRSIFFGYYCVCKIWYDILDYAYKCIWTYVDVLMLKCEV